MPPDGAKPASAGAGNRLQSESRSAIEQRLKGAFPTAQVIRSELIGDDVCVALGIRAVGAAPFLKMCRLLVEAGHDPGLRLEAFRGPMLCLCVPSIAVGADLEPSPRVGFVRRPAVRGALPARRNNQAGTSLLGD
jgi:hypothetical protein